MPRAIQCPVCGVDGTATANEIIARTLAAQTPAKTGLRVTAEAPPASAPTPPVAPHIQAPSQRKKKKTAVVLAVVVLLLVAGAAAGFFAWQRSQGGAVFASRSADDSSSSGAGKPSATWPQTPADVNAAYAEPPSGQNAATLFLQGIDAMVVSEGDKSSANLPLVGKMALPAPNEPLQAASKKQIGAFLQRNRKGIELFHQAAQLTGSRYPVDFSLGLETKLPHLSKIRTAGQVLVLFTIWNAESKKSDEAGDGVLSLLQLARSLEAEPTLISQLVRVAVTAQAQNALEQAIDRVALPPAKLERLQTAFNEAAQQEATGSSFTRAFLASYATSRSFFDMAPDDLVDMFSTNKVLGGSLFKTPDERKNVVSMVKKNARADREFFVESLKQVETARAEPFPARLKQADLLRARAEQAKTNQFTLSSMFLNSSGVDREASALATLKLAQTAIALERFRSANANRYPDSLSQLVPSLISDIPVDPFDGQPLRYGKKGGGYQVYSIGADKTDDQGRKMEKGKGDLVFTIVNPPKAISGSRSAPSAQPNKFDAELASAREHISQQRTNEAANVLMQIVEAPDASADTMLMVAREFMQISHMGGLEKTLERLVQVLPDNPEAWYDLAGLQSLRKKKSAATDSVIKALELSDARLRNNPSARDLRAEIPKDARFKALLEEPALKKALSQR